MSVGCWCDGDVGGWGVRDRGDGGEGRTFFCCVADYGFRGRGGGGESGHCGGVFGVGDDW